MFLYIIPYYFQILNSIILQLNAKNLPYMLRHIWQILCIKLNILYRYP